MTYNHINKEIIGELIRIAGERNVHLDPARIEDSPTMKPSKEEYGHMPDVVVTPQSTSAVAVIVRLANRVRIPSHPAVREAGFRAEPFRSTAASCCRSKRWAACAKSTTTTSP